MIKSVLLDVDGTLLDSNDAHAKAWVEAMAEQGITVTYDSVREKIGMGGDNLLPALLGISDEEKLGETLSKRRGELFRSKYLPSLKPFPGVRDLIQLLLKKEFKLVVATSSPTKDLKGLLKQAGVDDLLTEFTSSDDAENSKPDPDIVQEALKKAGYKPDHAIMLGDTPYDIEAARKAGVRTIAFTCGGWSREKLKGAAAVYKDAQDLVANFATSPLA